MATPQKDLQTWNDLLGRLRRLEKQNPHTLFNPIVISSGLHCPRQSFIPTKLQTLPIDIVETQQIMDYSGLNSEDLHDPRQLTFLRVPEDFTLHPKVDLGPLDRWTKGKTALVLPHEKNCLRVQRLIRNINNSIVTEKFDTPEDIENVKEGLKYLINQLDLIK